MIIYVLCYCCHKKKKRQNHTKEYRNNERASLVGGVQSANPTSRAFISKNRDAYQAIDGQNYLVRGSPNGGQPSLYQNVTQFVRAESTVPHTGTAEPTPADAPPAYEQLA